MKPGLGGFAVLTAAIVASSPSDARKLRSGHAPVNGLNIYYEVHGPRSKHHPPLVLLHGGGSTIETSFGRVLPRFARTRHVVAFEQQGHGRTADVPDRPFRFDQSADDTAALLCQLGIDAADLFGFSNGGNIAMQVALRHPGRVRKLVIGSAMFRRDGVYPEVWEFIKGSTPDTMPQEYRDAYRALSPHPDQLASFHHKTVRRMLEFEDWQPDDIRSIDVPTLVIVGDKDSIRPEHAAEMVRLLPQGRLAVLPGGHGAYVGEVTAAQLENSQVHFDRSGSKSETRIPELVVHMIEEFLDAPSP